MRVFDLKKYRDEIIRLPNDLKTEEERVNAAVRKYFEFSKQSIESKLVCCFIVWSLSYNTLRWNNFLFKVGLDEEKHKSQIKKYKVIGLNFEKLMKYIDVLPNRWSTVYQIANLPDSKLQELADKKILHPNVTAAELMPYIKSKIRGSKKNQVSSDNYVNIRFSENLTKDQIEEMIDTINDWRQREMIEFDDARLTVNHDINLLKNTDNALNLTQH